MALLRLLEHGSAASGRPCIGRPEPPAPWPPWIVCALDAFTGPLPGRARSSWTLGHRLRTAPAGRGIRADGGIGAQGCGHRRPCARA
eukprot:362384-Chlamydomonas_euryale.AAC.8